MSKKVDTEQEAKGGLKPKLRFPEFEDGLEWKEKSLGEVISLEYGGPLPEQSRRGGSIPVVGSNGVVGYHDEYLVEGPAIIIGRKGSAGQVNWIGSNCYPIDTTFYVKCKNPDNYLMLFLKLILEKRNLESLKDNGAVPGLNRNEVYFIKALFPKMAEQQKIADCLSSLDELITAESQKLEHLQTHKKGLMQQLFPAEGETVPKLRFPEFEGGLEWKERGLSEFISERDQASNDTTPLFSLTIEDGITPKTERYERAFLVSDEESAYKMVLPDDFAYNPMNLRFGAIARHSGKVPVALSKYYDIFYCNKTVDSRFCEFYFRSYNMIMFYDKMATGSLIEKRRVHFSEFLKFRIPFPSLLEQKAIADCLSSLDELVTAQKQKLELLKTHKKGLMQQLFPAPDEAQA